MRLALVVEARADAEDAQILADRVMVECGPDWVDAENIEHLRTWTGIPPAAPFTRWDKLDEVFPHRTSRLHGKTQGPDYLAARKALTAALSFHTTAPLDALVLMRDMDNQPRRREGIEAAREEMRDALPFAVLIAAPDPKREAWVLLAFEPRDGTERARLEAEQSRLSFDPTHEPHRLRGRKGRPGAEGERDIKQALATLTTGARDREIEALRGMPLRRLMQRGVSSGLRRFLHEEAKARLVDARLHQRPTDCRALPRQVRRINASGSRQNRARRSSRDGE
jgi:hypothetical protein